MAKATDHAGNVAFARAKVTVASSVKLASPASPTKRVRPN
jgi:hypothetical protein